MNIGTNIKEPRFLLMYSPQRFDAKYGTVKPEGSLGILYLAGALRNANFNVEVLDCCVGNDSHTLEETFNRQVSLPNGMVRVGMAPETIVKEVEEYDVIGISSIFTPQTKMVEELVRLISGTYPNKLIIMGGINARTQMSIFFEAGADIICLSESEQTIVDIGNVLRRDSRDFSGVAGIAFKHDGKIKMNPVGAVEQDLDKLPIPARDMLPLDRFWKIARPHGGSIFDKPPAYASAMTSRGCPYTCSFCHISGEGEGSISGNIGKFRFQSEERVMREMEILKQLGVQYVFIEDDSLLAKKKRALNIFKMLINFGLELGDVNGVNLSHLFTNKNGRLVIDDEMLETMAEAGFSKLVFPVEAGSQRVIDKWVSGKISHTKYDISALIRKANTLGIEVASVYLIGYPDETYEEIMQTLLVAKEHRDAGSSYVNLTMVTPFPGTALYDHVVRNNLFLPGIELADLDWMYPSMKTLIDPWILEFISRKAWEFLNSPERIDKIRSMAPQTT
jgi:anaerobic magnesium-protoporphyrin IX monomethyl ester cyclase